MDEVMIDDYLTDPDVWVLDNEDIKPKTVEERKQLFEKHWPNKVQCLIAFKYLGWKGISGSVR